MSKNLVIVESPAKAKTIEKFLGKDYHVLSSQGHIRDIDGVGKNSIGIDFEHDYAPNYVLDSTKHALIQTLQREAEKAETVWLASDEDREGEAIAWHLKEVLKLRDDNTKRIVFHEITKTAIQNALLHPRGIDYHLVNAQQARRVVDRIVGFELSPVLWRKVTTGLSAGRVQSVAVRLVVEREREIEDFVETSQYRVFADFIGLTVDGNEASLHTELNHRFSTKEEAAAFLRSCAQAQFSVSSIQTKPNHRSPAPPFTTSSLQQEAARKLKFPVSKTMRLAQSLYEAGHITYMRTDSVNLSSLAISTAKQQIIAEYGEGYHQVRQYHTTAKGAQEAHEAIRPTYMDAISAGGTQDEKRLYELIRKRTLACQMADAQTESTRIELSAKGIPYLFVASGEVVVFDGFMKVYIQSNDDEQSDTSSVLPKLSEHTAMAVQVYTAQQSFTKPPYRYTEASLVKRMEELGIGRPSTYAAIIETIQSRHYVERGNVLGHKREYNILTLKSGKLQDKNHTEMAGQDNMKLIPTDLGRMTNDFLVEQFPDILSYDFTAKEEETFDRIADGQADWVKTVDSFYHTFHPAIQSVPSGKVSGRLLGQDPETGEPVLAKISKIGPCIQIGDAEKDKPRFVSLKKGQSIYTITLDDALQLFASARPHTLMTIDGQDAVYGEGKYGPYIRYNGRFYSIDKDVNPDELTEDDIRTLFRRDEESRQPIRVISDDYQVMQGRYGLYLKTPENNVRLPKSVNVDTLTIEDCRALVDKSHAAEKHTKRNRNK